MMNEPEHDIETLFDQLGLPSDSAQIDSFVKKHALAGNTKIQEAPFWSESQSTFLREGLLADSEWAEAIDDLNTRLHS